MRRNLQYKVIFIIAVILLATWYTFPLDKRIKLGLDLQGGMHLVLRVDTSNLSEDSKKDAVERALEVLRTRIDEFGVSEPVVQRQGEKEIVVQLPGMKDRKRALDIVKRTGFLEFKFVRDDEEKLKLAKEGNVPEGFELKYIDEVAYLLEKKACLTGQAIKDARMQFSSEDFTRPYDVGIDFTQDGAKSFADLTKDNIGKKLAILLDGELKSAPVIQSHINDGKARITGTFTANEARDLAVILRVGSLPAPVYIEEERTIGPLLGKDSIRNGIKASLIGLALVFIFMAFYYRINGLIANFALLLNALFVLGSLGFIKAAIPAFSATLTLPGIAGIILTIGMAVDANILINERIREEQQENKPIRTCIANGYGKAFSAIFDSNVTTILAAVFLYMFGTGPIRGFAVTLTIGLLCSMFTAVFVTRAILELILLNKKVTSFKMLSFLKKTNIDFIGKRKIFYLISLAIIALSIYSFISRGKNLLGVDFQGGQIQEFLFKKPIPAQELRNSLKSVGLQDALIQEIKENPGQIIIRTGLDTQDKVQEKFKEDFKENSFEVLRIENVGPYVGKELAGKAIKAIIFALIGILVYVGFRFRHFDFATAGVIALFHDVIVALGLISLTTRQVDLLIVTALLTIAGYSINDTIVIYDRVRELTKLDRKRSLKDTINLAVNQTLSRTILTSFVTLLTVISLLIFGGEILNGFSFCLFVGFISGVYSTVFIASPLVLIWQRKK